jgi:hypothetical protein
LVTHTYGHVLPTVSVSGQNQIDYLYNAIRQYERNPEVSGPTEKFAREAIRKTVQPNLANRYPGTDKISELRPPEKTQREKNTLKVSKKESEIRPATFVEHKAETGPSSEPTGPSEHIRMGPRKPLPGEMQDINEEENKEEIGPLRESKENDLEIPSEPKLPELPSPIESKIRQYITAPKHASAAAEKARQKEFEKVEKEIARRAERDIDDEFEPIPRSAKPGKRRPTGIPKSESAAENRLKKDALDLEIERIDNLNRPTISSSQGPKDSSGKIGRPYEEPREGQGKFSKWKKGLYDDQIEKIINQKTKKIVPVIMADEIPKLLPLVSKDTKEFGFVINSEDSTKGDGIHWRACFISIPRREIDYFDSLVSHPTKEFLHDIKLLIDKIDPDTYLKLKTNMVQMQDNKTDNCGFFAAKWLIDMFRGRKFIDATKFNDSVKGEQDIQRFKRYI